jgi:hypothetical protein
MDPPQYTLAMLSRPNPTLRWICIAALVLSLAGFGVVYALTAHIQAIGFTHRDPASGMTYAIEDYWYVTPRLGLTRNALLLVSALIFAVSATTLFRREIWFYLWNRYLAEK